MEEKKSFYGTGEVPSTYVCSICGRHGVKLWRPLRNSDLLVCASCAEKAQSGRAYDEVMRWQGSDGEECITNRPTGRTIQMPCFSIDENGRIPVECSPGRGGSWPMTDQLSTSYGCLFPAVPREDGEFWGHYSLPDEGGKWWGKLPTR